MPKCLNCDCAAACMTWDLAESGKHFITTLINGSDLVPTFSTASIDDLRSEVLDLFLPTESNIYLTFMFDFQTYLFK